MKVMLIDFELAKRISSENAMTWSPVNVTRHRTPEMFDCVRGYNNKINLY